MTISDKLLQSIWVDEHYVEPKPVEIPVRGSIQWAMNRGTLYHVDGVGQYGQLACGESIQTYHDAAQCALYRSDLYCSFVPNGTVLTVWQVYGGGIGGFLMRNAQRFVVREGHAYPEVRCECCGFSRFDTHATAAEIGINDPICCGDVFTALGVGA